MAVVGRASYLNCRSAGDFFAAVTEDGCRRIVVDCAQCAGMDSTFLGMLAGAALRLRKVGGKLVILNPNERNFELIDNLGLGKIIEIENCESVGETGATSLPAANASTSGILDAHENLVAADESNRAKFEDVITFLKKETK